MYSIRQRLTAWYIYLRRPLSCFTWVSACQVWISGNLIIILMQKCSSSTKGPFQYFRKGLPLTHWGRVTHICVVDLGHHWFRQCYVACSAPSHYLNQCWNIVNWTFRNKLQWNFNLNSSIFIQEIAFENVACKMASILSRPQWVDIQCGVVITRSFFSKVLIKGTP